MSTWNHRVVRRVYEYAGNQTEELFQIHEVYYNSAGEITGMTENPVAPIGNDLEELKRNTEDFLKALSKPVLEYDIKLAENDCFTGLDLDEDDTVGEVW